MPINGLVTDIEVPTTADGKYKINYSNFAGAKRVGTPETLEVCCVVMPVCARVLCCRVLLGVLCCRVLLAVLCCCFVLWPCP